MELEQITVKKFKKISSVTLDLADLNILVGANSSGKSSILQAIHLASCLMLHTADTTKSVRNFPVNINELDYLPTNDYKKLGHDYDWKTQSLGNASTVSFSFNDNGNKSEARVAMKQARNAGISITGASNSMFRQDNPFSAYIPGISGISNEEQKQSKRAVLKACSLGDGNTYLRNALYLLAEESEYSVKIIERWIFDLIGKISIKVKHNDDKDLTIDATAKLGNKTVPLELLGTGYIQLIQIFCYLLLFKPKILLIDEPDIHLHPDVQEKLPKVLLKIAKESGIKIILATHSPFIVRGAPIDTNTYWMENGAIKNRNRQAVELALGWGAFGKKIILISEDTDTKILRHILAQWPDIEGKVTIHPGSGYNSLPTPEGAKQLKNTLGDNFKIVVHRDRDCMTNEEINKLTGLYNNEDIHLWVTDSSDIEAYFCEWSFIEQHSDLPTDFTKEKLNEIIGHNNAADHEKFKSQRGVHNKNIYPNGAGTPENEDVWNELQSCPLKAACGKVVFNQIKNILGKDRFSKDTILSKDLGGEVASSLKNLLENLL